MAIKAGALEKAHRMVPDLDAHHQSRVINMQNKVKIKNGSGATVKPVLSSHSKEHPKCVFKTDNRLNACQKYCRMLCMSKAL